MALINVYFVQFPEDDGLINLRDYRHVHRDKVYVKSLVIGLSIVNQRYIFIISRHSLIE